jgi:hypothetical protein
MALVLVAVAAIAGGPAAEAATRANGNDTTKLSWRSPELPRLWSIYLPRMVCPASHPYVLNEHFNGGSGFRVDPGVEVADYQRGLDVVALSALVIRYDKGHIRTGISGNKDFILNSATNWGGSARFTLVLHCTTDRKKGVYEKPHDGG